MNRSGERSWLPLCSQPPPTGWSGPDPRPAIAAAVILGVVPSWGFAGVQRGRMLAGAAGTTPLASQAGAAAQPPPAALPVIEAPRTIHLHLHGVSAEDLAAMMESLE